MIKPWERRLEGIPFPGTAIQTAWEIQQAMEAEIAELRAELNKLKQQEPVAWMHRSNDMHFIKERPLGEVGFLFKRLYLAAGASRP